MSCRGQLFLQLIVISMVSSCCATDRSNSKRLRWDQETDKQLDTAESPFPRTYYDSGTHKDRDMMFINNMAYDLSKKDQDMMWDLYLRKGYGPSLNAPTHDDDRHQEDLASLGLNNATKGTDKKQIDVNLHVNRGIPEGQHTETDNNNILRTYPDAVASRILDQYEITKSSRIAPEYERDVTNALHSNEQTHTSEDSSFTIIQEEEENQWLQTTQEPIQMTTGQPSVEDELVESEEAITSRVSLLSYLWDTLKGNIGRLLVREMRDNIINTLWSWWMSIVEFAKTRGKRAAIQ